MQTAMIDFEPPHSARTESGDCDAWLRYVPRLESCPACGYSLKGLPARHHCPECGFEYGPDTIGWRPKGILPNLKLSVVVFLLVVLALYFVLPMTPLKPERTTLIYSGLTIWAIFLAGDLGRLLSRPYLILNRHCLLIRNRSRVRTIPWSDVESIETHEIGSRRLTKIKLRNAARPLHVSSLLGKDAESHAQFRQVATAYLRSSQRQSEPG